MGKTRVVGGPKSIEDDDDRKIRQFLADVRDNGIISEHRPPSAHNNYRVCFCTATLLFQAVFSDRLLGSVFPDRTSRQGGRARLVRPRKPQNDLRGRRSARSGKSGGWRRRTRI